MSVMTGDTTTPATAIEPARPGDSSDPSDPSDPTGLAALPDRPHARRIAVAEHEVLAVEHAAVGVEIDHLHAFYGSTWCCGTSR